MSVNYTYDLTQLSLTVGTHSITAKAKKAGYIDSDASNAVSYTVYPKIAPPSRNDVVTAGAGSYVSAKSSFIDEAEEYEYFIDGVSVGTAPLSFSVWGYSALMGQSGSNCAVYAKVNSDTVSTSDYTWYVESNGTFHGPSMSNPIGDVTKVAIMSSRNDGRPMATCGEWTIQQSTTPVVAKLHGDTAIALIYGPANS